MVQAWTLPLDGARASTQELHCAAIERVIQVMHTRLNESLSLENMSEIACMSPFYFNRVFRRTIGLPPGEFLAALRMDAAKRLLLTTDLSVTDICFEVGYSGLGSFTTRFTQQVGVPPRLLRLLATKINPLKVTLPAALPRNSRADHVSLTGSVRTPHPFSGDIFIGLFPRPVPQGRPVRCAQLHTAGPFYIDAIPEGIYYLLVAAFPRSDNLRAYLLPPKSLLIGSLGPLSLRSKEALFPVEVWLRPWRPTDPPIVTALPYL